MLKNKKGVLGAGWRHPWVWILIVIWICYDFFDLESGWWAGLILIVCVLLYLAIKSVFWQSIGGGYTKRDIYDERDWFEVTCSDCGKETTVPFKPDGIRPIYCYECYLKRR